MGFNKVILQGNLSEDITLRHNNNGDANAKVSIAVGKKFKKQDGSIGKKTLFVRLQFWGNLATILNQYCKKGSKILIDGELENQNWEDNQGQKHYDFIINVSSMQMLDSKQGSNQSNNNQTNQGYQQQPQQQHPNNNIPEIDIDEDEIPF